MVEGVGFIFVVLGWILLLLSFFVPDVAKYSADANWLAKGLLLTTGFIIMVIGGALVAIGIHFRK